jgi:hypothetical protein
MGDRGDCGLRIIMAIGVLIAPILLYWEALSSEFEDKATFSATRLRQPLLDPPISALRAVRRFDEERVSFYLEQLVLIGGPRRNAAKSVAEVSIEKGAAPYGPSAREIRDDPRPLPDLTGKRPVGFKRIVAALSRVSVSPMPYEFLSTLSFYPGARCEQ